MDFFEKLSYTPSTGIFVWTENTRHTKVGVVAGYKSTNGSIRISIDGKNYLAHRLAWFFVNGKWPEYVIDHINGDRADNRIANLRDVPQSVNLQNQRRPMSHSKSPYLGVRWESDRCRWTAEIYVNKVRHRLGRFNSAEEAYAAYLEAKRRLHPGCTI